MTSADSSASIVVLCGKCTESTSTTRAKAAACAENASSWIRRVREIVCLSYIPAYSDARGVDFGSLDNWANILVFGCTETKEKYPFCRCPYSSKFIAPAMYNIIPRLGYSGDFVAERLSSDCHVGRSSQSRSIPRLCNMERILKMPYSCRPRASDFKACVRNC